MRIMNKFLAIFFIFISFLTISCATKNNFVQETVVIDKQPEIISEDTEVEDLDEVILIEETIDKTDAEYLRSTDNLSKDELVTKEEFEQDKAQILQIISELSEIMEKEDYDSWLNYIDSNSITYWTNKKNIMNAQLKLPNKSIKLRNLRDYFKYIFIPARKRSKVDEIRYISKTNIKAVEVKEDESVVVYYYFIKNNDNEWKVQLPTL